MYQSVRDFSRRFQCLSGAQLKVIAMVTMLIDHVNKALIYPNLVSNDGFLNAVSNLFDILGRIAFPLFCFLLVEGFFKTRNRGKYLLNLLLFGALSEVPFDMFVSASFYNANWNNVMFSLALVLVTIWSIDALKGKMRNQPTVCWYFASIGIVLFMCVVAMFFSVDYEHHAILIGYFFYLFHDTPMLAIPFCYACLYTTPWALLGFLLTLTYNGQRGRQSKWINYGFYPVHLLILGALRMLLGI